MLSVINPLHYMYNCAKVSLSSVEFPSPKYLTESVKNKDEVISYRVESDSNTEI